jgi:hypothetical protein
LKRPRPPNRSASDAHSRSQSIEQQRAAVRERLLQARLQGLPELEARWAAELRAEYDTDAIRAERDAAWHEAFQQHGQARFPLLVALILAAPDSDARREAQARLDQHDRAWQQREQAIEAAYQARLRRIEQEIAVRVNARRREFVRNAEQEIQAQLAAQPDPADLYLPPPQTPSPAPARKASFPPCASAMPARDSARRAARPIRRRRADAPSDSAPTRRGVGASKRLHAHRRPARARLHRRFHPLPARQIAQHRPQPVLPRRVVA